MADETTTTALMCEACGETHSPDAPGRMVTADGCEICPSCAADLRAEWEAMSDEEKARYA